MYIEFNTEGIKNFALYDLINDRSEKENIIEKEPEIASAMKKELKESMKSVNKSKKGKNY